MIFVNSQQSTEYKNINPLSLCQEEFLGVKFLRINLPGQSSFSAFYPSEGEPPDELALDEDDHGDDWQTHRGGKGGSLSREIPPPLRNAGRRNNPDLHQGWR
jgi:hypothetical protein